MCYVPVPPRPNAEICEQLRSFLYYHYINLSLALVQPKVLGQHAGIPASVLLIQRQDFQQSGQDQITHHVIKYLPDQIGARTPQYQSPVGARRRKPDR